MDSINYQSLVAVRRINAIRVKLEDKKVRTIVYHTIYFKKFIPLNLFLN